MAINNVSGNFQPLTATGGKKLPEEVSAQPTVNPVAKTKSDNIAKLNPSEAALAQKARVRQVSEAIQQEAAFTQNIARRLQFQVDEEVGVTVVKVYDKVTDELIRQFPPEELLNLSKRLKALNEDQTSPSGVLLQEKV